jgi:ubiquinone/menaquinone biosynthesis C-methylase UbiE
MTKNNSAELLKRWFPISAYDLATLDKIPVLDLLMGRISDGLSLDIGIGTGYTTCRIFRDRPVVYLDLHEPNLRYFRERLSKIYPTATPLCIVARATQLPFKAEAFRHILCSEVLEHLEDDRSGVSELARVLSSQGKAVVSVPYTGLGFATFLEGFGIKTVHDFPGPEYHFRPGYDDNSIKLLMATYGLIIEQSAFYLRFFTRLVVDAISVANIIYQRLINQRRSWTWSDMEGVERSIAFRIHTFVFPVLRAFLSIDHLLKRFRGFGLVVAVRKTKR